MKLHPTTIPGCFAIELVPHVDPRGNFVKTFRASLFRGLGLEDCFTESFYSTSAKGVLRGIHFQLPPSDGAKLISCLQGQVLDVALDLRVGSPAFGVAATFDLSGDRAMAAYIPRGVGHGFQVTSGPATLVYNVSSEHDPARDAGVRWDSFGLHWPITEPQLSSRDQNFPALPEFASPFRFEGPGVGQ